MQMPRLSYGRGTRPLICPSSRASVILCDSIKMTQA